MTKTINKTITTGQVLQDDCISCDRIYKLFKDYLEEIKELKFKPLLKKPFMTLVNEIWK